MEEFAQGGRLSPKKVKEFIPAGTLGIGEDKNIWLRKARKDGATYWDEFLDTWNYKRFIPKGYDLTLGIHFRAEPKTDEKYGFDLKYGYYQAGGGFILDVYYADTQTTFAKHETFDAQQFRDDCIYVRDNIMPNDPLLKYEFSEIVGKLTSAFERGELRKDFIEETEPTPESREPLEPLFEVGDFVRVVKSGYHIPYFEEKKVEYKFDKPTDHPALKEGDEGYIVGYFEDDADGEWEIVYVVKNQGETGNINLEFLINGEGLELVKKAPQINEEVIMNDTNFMYPSAPTIKERLGFKNPEKITSSKEVYLSYGKIFTKGQDPYTLMPIYGIYSPFLEQEVLMGIKGFDSQQDPLKNKKIIIYNAEENTLIQKFAFELGYFWLGSERNVVQEFESYPAYLEFTDYKTIFALERKDFKELESRETTLQELGLLAPKFKVGDYVRVKNHLHQVMKAYSKQKEYKFEYPDVVSDIQNGAEGYVVGVYYEPDYKENRVVVKKYQDDHKILHEFIISEEGLEKLISAPEIGDKVYIEKSNWIYPASYHEKALLGFKNPEEMTKTGLFSYETATIFASGQHPFNLMPWYGVRIASNEEALIGIQGIEITERSTSETPTTPTEEIPAQEIEFTCKVDASKINSAYVGAFYAKNKERINKLNSEFSCKILEALVYLSDYEKCGGGVELPKRELEEEDDLLGAIRNLKN